MPRKTLTTPLYGKYFMRKLLSISLLLAITVTAGAQTIQKGNKFFDGKALYTVQEVRMGTIVYMTGTNAAGDYLELTLEKTPGKAGEYTLQPSALADDSPFPGAYFGNTVRYVRQQGMNFLAVEGNFGGLVEILVLTPDYLDNCLKQQEFAETVSLSDLASDLLLNSRLVVPWASPALQEIADGKLNKKVPTVIENYNRQLIKGTLAFRDAMEMFDNPDGLGGDGRGEDEIAAENAIIDRINQIFNDIARRNAGGEGNPAPEDIEKMYTTKHWQETENAVFKKDEESDGIGFFDHDYWTFSQDPSPDIKVIKIQVEDFDEERAEVFVRFINWPGSKPQTMWMALIQEDGEWRVDNIRNYDNAYDDGFFDYMKEMQLYLDE